MEHPAWAVSGRALLLLFARTRQREDGATILYGRHPASAETATITNAVYFVKNGSRPVAGAQKVAV